MTKKSKYIDLSARLSALADMVTPGYRLADVGCDHAHLPIRLCQEDRIPSAIAMDVNEGPLKRAMENIEEAGLSDRIEIRLSNGLERLQAGEADCVVIAGMGGQLITEILKKKPALIKGPSAIKELVLGPHSEPEKVRSLLYSCGYRIVDENFIEEDGKYYPVIKAQRKVCAIEENSIEGAVQPDPVELAFGPVLLERKNPVLLRYLLHQRKQILTIEDHLNHQNTENAGRRLVSLKEEEQLVAEALERIQSGKENA